MMKNPLKGTAESTKFSPVALGPQGRVDQASTKDIFCEKEKISKNFCSNFKKFKNHTRGKNEKKKPGAKRETNYDVVPPH